MNVSYVCTLSLDIQIFYACFLRIIHDVFHVFLKMKFWKSVHTTTNLQIAISYQLNLLIIYLPEVIFAITVHSLFA